MRKKKKATTYLCCQSRFCYVTTRDRLWLFFGAGWRKTATFDWKTLRQLSCLGQTRENSWQLFESRWESPRLHESLSTIESKSLNCRLLLPYSGCQTERLFLHGFRLQLVFTSGRFCPTLVRKYPLVPRVLLLLFGPGLILGSIIILQSPQAHPQGYFYFMFYSPPPAHKKGQFPTPHDWLRHQLCKSDCFVLEEKH